MLKHAVLVCSLAATALAQSPLASNNAPNNLGNVGGGVYFDIRVGANNVQWDQIAWVPAGLAAASTGMESIDIYMGPSTWEGNTTDASAWTLIRTSAIVDLNATGLGMMSIPATLLDPNTLQPSPICLDADTCYGIALVATNGASGFSHNYTNGDVACPLTAGAGIGICPVDPAVPIPVVIGGNQSQQTNELRFEGGAAQNAFLTGGLFCPRVWNGEIHYSSTPCGTPIAIGTAEPYGVGCVRDRESWGELFPNPSTSLDVDGLQIDLTFLGNGYLAVASTPGSNPYVPPGASAVPLNNLLANTDTESVAAALGLPALPFPILYPRGDGTAGVALDLEVCASGYITPVDPAGLSAPPAGANVGDNTPTVDEFFGNDPGNVTVERWGPLWQSMLPASNVWAEIDAAGDLVISWDNVVQAGTGTNTFQVAFSASGNVSYRYNQGQAGNGGGGAPVIIGWTTGVMSLQEEVDISNVNLTTAPLDNQELLLRLSARPVIGTNPDIVVDGYDPAQAGLVFLLFDFAQQNPGISLSPFGADGCSGYVSLGFFASGLGTGGVAPASRSLINGGIPMGQGLAGVSFFVQAAALQANCANGPCNNLGATFSAGLRVFLGTL